ncbi:Cyclin-H [Thelohanellus kitauei]|uniref:Cyclin-H n=1 Tax=Thelohanellus kitauei TaxID=669202 RepID=A0A0C2MKQ5_THEKT|nr:Cyclin-H [Thelohanellus kitauei]
MDDDIVCLTYLNDLLVKSLSYFRDELQLGIYSTSCQLFHKVYKKASPVYDPYIICCSCIYLACKIEDAPIKCKRLLEVFKKGERSDLLMATISAEIYLLETLDFKINFDSPFQALEGMMIEFKCYSIFPKDCNTEQLFTDCIRFIKTALLINHLVMTHSMSQIACSATCAIYGEATCRAYLDTICPEATTAMMSVISEIIKTVGEFDAHKTIPYEVPVFENTEEMSPIF